MAPHLSVNWMSGLLHFQRSPFQISARRLAILKEVSCGIPPFIQANDGVVPQINSTQLPATVLLQVWYSLMVLL